MKTNKLIMQHLKKQPKRSISIILSIILAVCLITTIGIIGECIKNSAIENVKRTRGFYHLQYKNITKNNVNYIQNIKQVDKVGTLLLLGYCNNGNSSLNIQGVSDNYFDMFYRPLIKGKYPKKSNEICIDEWYLKKLNIPTQIGQKIPLTLNKILMKDNKPVLKKDKIPIMHKTTQTFILSGILKDKAGSKVDNTAFGYVPLKTVENLLPKNYLYYYSFLQINKNTDINTLKNKIDVNLNLGSENSEINYNLISASGENLKSKIAVLILTLIVSIAAIAVIYNIFNMSIIDRIKEFGILRCIGFRPIHIKNLVIKEGLLLSIIGIPIGLFLGLLISKIVYLKVDQIYEQQKILFIFSNKILIFSALIGLITVLLSTLAPSKKASKVSPIEAVCGTKNLEVNILKKRKWHKLIKNTFGNIGMISYKNLWRNKKRTKVTIISLSTTIILFITFSYFVTHMPVSNPEQYFKNGQFKLQIERNFIPQNGYSKKDIEQIKLLPDIENVYEMKFLTGNALLEDNFVKKDIIKDTYVQTTKDETTNKISTPISFKGYNDDMLKILRKNIVKGSIDINKMKKEPIVLIGLDPSKKISKYLNLKVGDIITLNVTNDFKNEKFYKKEQKFIVGGFVDKIPFSLIHNQTLDIIASNDILKTLCPYDNFKRLDIKIEDPSKKDYVFSHLQKTSNKISGSKLYSFYEDVASLKQAKRNINFLIYSFITIIALIAILNIINTMNTSIIVRKNEFGIMRAVGFTKEHLKKSVLLEALFFAILSSILGILISGISCSFVKVLFEIQHGTPAIPMIIAFVLSTFISIIAVLVPIKKIVCDNIVDTIRYVE
ncbi:ABC transporter permease (plasmid) [Haloimpatiens sp. FM7330]|uniref:ABC transporter permease n=1 Tax=Haloimpatiens sp. FM7330 TaxID=3298610 RepID=UPI00362EA5FC